MNAEKHSIGDFKELPQDQERSFAALSATDEFWATLKEARDILDKLTQTGMRYEDKVINQPMRQICRATAEYFNVPYMDMMSRRRKTSLVVARNHAIFACLRFTKNGYSDIGRFFERDHSTIMHSERQLQRLKDHKPLQDFLDYIEGVVKIT